MPNRRRVLAGLAACALPVPSVLAQAKTEISISRQPGILYMPTHVIEKRGLVEKHAARLGVRAPKVAWVNFAGGGAQQDALLSGSVDMINTGTGNLLLLWDRTRGGVKGIAASSAQPLGLVTREDRIRTLEDFRPGDKIAVPTVKVSTQAILLQMAAGRMFGAARVGHFDDLTVQLSHPDAYAALRNAAHEVRSHFAAPPFQFYALKNVPGARQIATSAEIIGGPLTQGQFFATTRFADANPAFVRAVRAAAEEAKAAIESETRACVETYREVTGDRTDTGEILDLLAQPGMMEWNIHPQGTMKFAAHLHAIGTLRTAPASWRDYYLPVAHDLPGG
ncbi:MAG: ABC transporter substrate-binding protein [Tagaea sp.]|nr:ABC transporter substrate-binding protein [Azospirillum sp.]MCA3267695.1 ABC transporter substrate-binding protein [Azospirillum sp.]